jgi:hypothetical protein
MHLYRRLSAVLAARAGTASECRRQRGHSPPLRAENAELIVNVSTVHICTRQRNSRTSFNSLSKSIDLLLTGRDSEDAFSLQT